MIFCWNFCARTVHISCSLLLTRWGYRWGAEDVDIMNRMLKHIPLTVRTKEDNFEHLHSGSSRSTYKFYYKNKNLYDGDLPVTPLTSKLEDPAMAKRLYTWARPKMGPSTLTDHAIYATHNAQNNRNIYDIRYRDSKGEHYYAVVESLLWRNNPLVPKNLGC